MSIYDNESDEEDEDTIPSDKELKKLDFKELKSLAKEHDVSIDSRIKDKGKMQKAFVEALSEEREEQQEYAKESAKLEKKTVKALIKLAEEEDCYDTKLEKKIDKLVDNDDEDSAKELLIETILEAREKEE